MDLAVAQKASPEEIVGFDVVPVDAEALLAQARADNRLTCELPPNLRFERCDDDRIPAADGSFDLAFSWSAFEHITQPVPVLREIRRILRPDGVLMIQLWPFYFSEHGSHLTEWYPEGFVQLQRSIHEIEWEVRNNPKKSEAWTEALLTAYRELNRITVDDLHRCLLASHFAVAKLFLLSEPVHLPMELSDLPLSLLGISGVKLLAIPR